MDWPLAAIVILALTIATSVDAFIQHVLLRRTRFERDWWKARAQERQKTIDDLRQRAQLNGAVPH